MNTQYAKRDYDPTRIRNAYFADPQRRITIPAGQVLMEPGDYNDRLYLIEKGCLVGYRPQHDGKEPVELFRLGAGTFLGLHSFFSQCYLSYALIIAEQESTLAWIDTETEAVEPNRYGSLAEQFIPAIIAELYRRQMRILTEAEERQVAQRQLFEAEKMTTLGQLAAGLAHELNNALGVISRNTDHLTTFFNGLLQEQFPKEYRWFERGLAQGQLTGSAEVRKRARHYQQTLGLERDAARTLARMAPHESSLRALGDDVVQCVDEAARFWEVGRDCHDVQLAARHAESIVRSVRILGGGDHTPGPGVDLLESINEGMALVKSALRKVNLNLTLTQVPAVYGNASELVQIWVNLIKNACDAMQNAETPLPTLTIATQVQGGKVHVMISDNGPGIPAELQQKVFEPSFTTKKSGLSFGLGLGLAIVRRIVESYGGQIQLSSRPGQTTFRVVLPVDKE